MYWIVVLREDVWRDTQTSTLMRCRRVLALVRKWMQFHYEDFVADPQLLASLLEFLENDVKAGGYTATIVQLERLHAKMKVSISIDVLLAHSLTLYVCVWNKPCTGGI